MWAHSNPSIKEYKTRHSTLVTQKLLEEISCSVSSFKPSASLAELASSSLHSNVDSSGNTPLAEIDVVISGGGMKGYFMVGCTYILAKELKKNNIMVARCSGTSAGSWGAMFLLLFIYAGFDNYFWIETFHQAHERPGVPLLDVYWEYYINHLRDNPLLFPADAYKICSGRLFISITEMTMSGPRLRIISEFSSNDDLVQTCCASSAIPWVSQTEFFRYYRGKYVCDGGIFNNTPVFPDGIRRQLVFRLVEVEYPFRLMVKALDTCIDVLVLRGALIMQRFLQGEVTDSIAWLDEKQSKKDLQRKPNYTLRRAIIPFIITGLVFFNGNVSERFWNLVDSVALHKHIRDTLIPFSEANKWFGQSSVGYVLKECFAFLVEKLRMANLLL